MKQVKQAVSDFLDGNSTRVWRKLVLFIFSIFLFGFTCFAAIGGWIAREVYSLPKEYVTCDRFDKHCDEVNKSQLTVITDLKREMGEYKKSVDKQADKYDKLLEFLLDKHYKGVNDAYNRNSETRDRK